MTDEPWWHDAGAGSNREDAVGSAAQEAGRLFGAMRDRMMADPATMRAGFKIMEAVTMLGRSGRPAAPGDAPECAYCPLCQAIARARTLSPETVERLTGAAMEFADVVKQVVGQGGGEGPDVVRHVPLDDDADSWSVQESGATPSDIDAWFEDTEPDEPNEPNESSRAGDPEDPPPTAQRDDKA